MELRAMVTWLLTGAVLAGTWLALPDPRAWRAEDGLYIREARRLGAAVAAEALPGWEVAATPILVTAGPDNYLVLGDGGTPSDGGDGSRGAAQEPEVPAGDAGGVPPGGAGGKGPGGSPPGRPVADPHLRVLHLDRPEIPVVVAGAFELNGVPTAIIPASRRMDQVASAVLTGSDAAAGGEQALLRGLVHAGRAGEARAEFFVTWILHELFHAYRIPAMGRWEESLDGVEQDDLWDVIYRDAANDRAQAEEGRLLAAAIAAPSDERARELARRFLEVREQRWAEWRRRLGAASSRGLRQVEAFYEWSEGLSRYIEIRAWEVAQGPGYQPLPAMAALEGFRGYQDDERFGRRPLIEATADPTGGGYVRERVYRLGAGQALVLDRLAPGWLERAVDGVGLTELLREAVSG